MHFLSPSTKNKKNPARKNSLYFRKWNFVALILKKTFIFFKRKLFLYFLKWNPVRFSSGSKNKKTFRSEKISYALQKKWDLLILILKNFLYFRKQKSFYISGNRTFLYFGKCIFRTMHNIFRTRSIFRNLIYLELEAYLKPWYI